ncbi:MAG: aminoglycoside N(3)-acetyltransferase [Pseudomonadales bacterium]
MKQLITIPTIVDGLTRLGVNHGDKLLVHCSLSSLGRVQGGSQAVVEALVSAVSEIGTLVMPTLTNGRFDPSEWGNPPAPEHQWQRIRFETPAFHPDKTPTDHTMSAVYELFRTWPGTLRSNHPHSSMAAWGVERERITRGHQLEERFGDSSPLGALYALDARVLFLGTSYDTSTCFHLAEYRVPNPPRREFLIVQGQGTQRQLVTYEDVDTNSSVFAQLGADFEAAVPVAVATIGAATCRLFSFRSAVDFAVQWLTKQRD